MKTITKHFSMLLIALTAATAMQTISPSTALGSDGRDMKTLNHLIDRAKMYYKGDDNNYISSTIMAQPLFYQKYDGRIMDLPNYHEVDNAIKTCVFMLEGAYGFHISVQKQNMMARSFIKDIKEAKNIKAIVAITGDFLVEDDILSAPCGLAILDEQNNVAILQTLTFD